MAGPYRHFTIEALAEGVWAVIHAMNPPAPDAWAIANAGIVDLGGRTILFDTLTATDATIELRAAAIALTARPPDVVVYSHAHYDHTWGGSQFPEALVVAGARARTTMLEEGAREADNFRKVAADRVAFWAAAAADDDPLVRRDAPYFEPYYRGIAATLPTLELRYPDIGFEGRLQIHGRERHVELTALDRAHAPGDTFMTVPDARIAFCGDLLFVGCHPYLGDGDLKGLRTAVGLLATSGADRVVPGHGPVSGPEGLVELSGYLDAVVDLARSGDVKASVPDRYRNWLLARFFAFNLEFCAAGGRQAS